MGKLWLKSWFWEVYLYVGNTQRIDILLEISKPYLLLLEIPTQTFYCWMFPAQNFYRWKIWTDVFYRWILFHWISRVINNQQKQLNPPSSHEQIRTFCFIQFHLRIWMCNVLYDMIGRVFKDDQSSLISRNQILTKAFFAPHHFPLFCREVQKRPFLWGQYRRL